MDKMIEKFFLFKPVVSKIKSDKRSGQGEHFSRPYFSHLSAGGHNLRRFFLLAASEPAQFYGAGAIAKSITNNLRASKMPAHPPGPGNSSLISRERISPEPSSSSAFKLEQVGLFIKNI